jgi:Spy/CpxP family protein refolding chaperone
MNVATRKRAVATVAIVLSCTVGAAVGLAQMAKQAWGGNTVERVYQKILAKLNLSQNQKSQIDALLAAEKPALQRLAQQLKGDAAALRAAVNAAQPDATAVGNALLKVHADGKALRAELQKVRQDTQAVLSPEQRGTFDAYLDAWHGGFRRFRFMKG